MFDIKKSRNFLLKENIEEPLDEMAKISGDLKAAIEKVISDNKELNGLPLKKAIRADVTVQDALAGDDLYDNQLNKFIATAKGERPAMTKGRAVGPKSLAKTDFGKEAPLAPDTSMEEPDDEISDAWNEPEESEDELEPSMGDMDSSIDITTPTDAGGVDSANSYKNIIVKKVNKIEALPGNERASSIDMQALKKFIQKPEVVKALTISTIRDLVSPIIG